MTAVNTISDPRIATAECTCPAFPTEYTGQLIDGRTWYFRYRRGHLWFGAGASLDEAVDSARDRRGVRRELYAARWDGELPSDEVAAIMPSLLDEIARSGWVMDELVAWLRAALDDDAEVAAAANRNPEEPWYDEGAPTPEQEAHADRWNPARVLAEVEAKRARIDLLAQVATGAMVLGESHQNQDAEAVFAVRLLCVEAQPLAARPGFKPEWRLT